MLVSAITSPMFAAVEAVPLQNQAAAQVLLEKMKHSSSNERQYRGRRGRGRGRGREEDDSAVLTLEEWEKRKTSGGAVAAADNPSDTTRDEDLAWQLQNQFDLGDSYVSYKNVYFPYYQSSVFSIRY